MVDLNQTVTIPFGKRAIEQATRIILEGGCVAVPTETVYGLAADATNEEAIAGIYAAKGRPSFNPLIVHVPDMASAEGIAEFDDDARALAGHFWPGPLTIVLPVRPGAVASNATAGLATVALRISAHRAMHALLQSCGRPLAAPSANASNRISPTRAEHVLETLDGRIALVIDDGPTSAGIESTIIQGRSILRPGPITAELFASCLPPATSRKQAPYVPIASVERPDVVAPGLLPIHYAPSKPLRLEATARGEREWLVGFGGVRGDDTLSLSGKLAEAASSLFDVLHRADASGRDKIAVAPVPLTGLGVAINDRLRRAAGPRN